ncbi:MAG: fused phosphoenolpyruvate-protein phosphotransferase PtsP/GAF domain protein [Syntrophaceae bacterium PtaB.Bin038]|nr:MAG: fused phosphoenolpyruvate-protein phosphotransferase PtsP/GAF domain protein [Syntrophaceae bacterium PtaB.Bin038]
MARKKTLHDNGEQSGGGKGSSAEKRFSALLTISRAITSEKYLEDILRLIVTVTAEVMGSKICSLMLIGDDGKLHVKATQSISKEYNKKRVLEVGKGVVGKVASENRPAIVRDVREREDYQYPEMARKEGLVSLLSVPLAVKGRVIGVINCYTSRPHDFTEAEVTVLTTIANQAAIAIENTELLVRSRVIQEELESRKIIERAKDILAAENGIGGDEAYRKIQAMSMNMRRPMRQIAEAIIISRGVHESS